MEKEKRDMTKTVAITGATGTLGQAVINRFYGNSSTGLPDNYICVTARNIKKNYFGFCTCVSLDVTDERAVRGFFSSIDPVDILVTCAGVSLVKPSLELIAEEWRYVIDVNLTGTFLSIREAVKHGATRIVTIGSIHGSTPTSYPQRAAYTASKAGVVGLTQALAVELAPQGVAINCVAPGHLPVLMDGTGAGNELLEAARARTPTGRLTTPEEVAEVIYWLCNDAPMNLTGQVIAVSGGFELNTWPISEQARVPQYDRRKWHKSPEREPISKHVYECFEVPCEHQGKS